jgi:polyisoprenoid-binding protein YceI
MMNRIVRLLAFVACPVVPCAAAPGTAHHYMLDATRSEVSAKVTVMAISSMSARFPGLSGSADLSPDNPDAFGIDVVLDTRLLTATDDSVRDQLKGPDFFDVDHFPVVRFTGGRLIMTGERTAQLFGALTVRGVTRPVTLDVSFNGSPAQAIGTEPMAISASTRIDRDDFGMIAMHGLVSRTVTILIKAMMMPG